jgi:hypothetical protein
MAATGLHQSIRFGKMRDHNKTTGMMPAPHIRIDDCYVDGGLSKISLWCRRHVVMIAAISSLSGVVVCGFSFRPIS